MKRRLTFLLLFIGPLLTSSGAQDNGSGQSTKNVIAPSLQGQSSATNIPLTQARVQPFHNIKAHAQAGSDNGKKTIVVNVWSRAAVEEAPTNETDPAQLSPAFAVAASKAASSLQFTEGRIENSIRMGFPLGRGFWIRTDFDAIDDSLTVASLSARSDSDWQALRLLQDQTNRLRTWCDWLMDQNRNLRLADYFVSPEPLDNDEQFQNTLVCTRFLTSMLARGKFAEDSSCR